ncbi:hypothetical protein D3875_00965 [Deinococcus cavernae]|uniref:5'-Nucleotidase C-terminal domain-containing protein n=1 Tax=Deinococcus cavernae TaxID=2320857 RepID=A0A418VHN1_9DEIO|nr:hypothetical protein D3875_00965 [Deinococcus cavernae]
MTLQCGASHAGVVADKAILGLLKGSNLVVGGHDHLHLRHDLPGGLYLHNGFKGELLNVVAVKLGGAGATLTSQDFPITASVAADSLLSTLVKAQEQKHLTTEDKAVIGHLTRSYSVQEAAQWAVESVKQATGADVVAINHTSFGRGFRPGPVSRRDFNEFLRFDNKLVRITLDAAMLRGLLKLANQHRATRFEELTGDFVYTNAVQPEDGQQYTLVTVDFLALPQNQARYFGRDGLKFEPVGTLTSKAVLEAALSK